MLKQLFGKYLRDKGILSAEQYAEISGKMEGENSYLKFMEVLRSGRYLPADRINAELDSFIRENDYTDEEIAEIKTGDVEGILRAFAPGVNFYMIKFMSMVIKDLMKRVTPEVYIGRLKPAGVFDFAAIAGQRTVGDRESLVSLAEQNCTDGFRFVAGGFSGKVYDTLTTEVFDAVAEYCNSLNGIFSMELSKAQINQELELPFAYREGTARGPAFILPINIGGHDMYLYGALGRTLEISGKKIELTKTERRRVKNPDGRKALVVDDSNVSRNILADILEECGFNIAGEGVNGEEAVELYKKLKPDIVTLDITMPVKDGITALREIMAIDSAAVVVMVTAAGQQSKYVEAVKLGATEFICKPYNRADVISCIKGII